MPAPPDELLRGVSADGQLTVRTLVATGLVAEAARRHAASPLAAHALGRTLMGTLLLGSLGKGEDTVQVRFSGDGPLRSLTAIGDADGRVRGHVGHPEVELPLAGGAPDVARGIGLGRLSVVRFSPGRREPYTGIVPIASGEIAKDIALYLAESEQTPSAIALGVYLERERGVTAAGGTLAQALPGADGDAVARLEANVRGLPPMSELVGSGVDARGILERVLHGLGARVLYSVTPLFECSCSLERVLRAVAMLGREELEEAVLSGAPVEVRCEFCGDVYNVDAERAKALLHPLRA